jgi:hypothetical protein
VFLFLFASSNPKSLVVHRSILICFPHNSIPFWSNPCNYSAFLGTSHSIVIRRSATPRFYMKDEDTRGGFGLLRPRENLRPTNYIPSDSSYQPSLLCVTTLNTCMCFTPVHQIAMKFDISCVHLVVLPFIPFLLY